MFVLAALSRDFRFPVEPNNTANKMPNTQRVYVGNLAHDARERDVEKFFKGYGKFGEVSMKQGYGFVDFEDYRDADDAVHDLNGKDLLGERDIHY